MSSYVVGFKVDYINMTINIAEYLEFKATALINTYSDTFI